MWNIAKCGLAVCLMFFSAVPLAMQAHATEPYYVTGHVYDVDGPVGGVQLDITDIEEDYTWQVTTDTSGEYSQDVSGVAQNGHTIAIDINTPAGYLPSERITEIISTMDEGYAQILCDYLLVKLPSESAYDSVYLGKAMYNDFTDANRDELKNDGVSVTRSANSVGLSIAATWGWSVHNMYPYKVSDGGHRFTYEDTKYEGEVDFMVRVLQYWHEVDGTEYYRVCPIAGGDTMYLDELDKEFNSQDQCRVFATIANPVVYNGDIQGGDINNLQDRAKFIYNGHYMKFEVQIWWYETLLGYLDGSARPYAAGTSYSYWLPSATLNEGEVEYISVMYDVQGKFW